VSILASFISGSIGGSITGATVAHFLSKRRDKEIRRASFLRFLKAWEKEVDFDRQITHWPPLPPGAVKTIGNVARDFMAKRIGLAEKARALEPNYRSKRLTRFQGLAETIVDMPLGQIDDDPKQLLRALRDLADFVENN
jgi:hypothetical protein